MVFWKIIKLIYTTSFVHQPSTEVFRGKVEDIAKCASLVIEPLQLILPTVKFNVESQFAIFLHFFCFFLFCFDFFFFFFVI